ncbi:MAG: L,D-transpeptidase family protein [Mycobacteriales bacterium]
MHRRPLTTLVGLTALALTLTACTGGSSSVVLDAAAAPPAPPIVETEPAALPTEVAEPSAEPSAEPVLERSPAAPATPSYDVAAAQRTLADLGYYLGVADGRRGPAFRSAVMAFQKVQGLGADGTIGAATLQALSAPKKPVLKDSGPSNRVEIDLTKQVLYVVKGGAVQRILPISSGNGATYAQKDGSKAKALTPVGWYKVERRIVGVREADLGTLYDPQYFYRGWAIHGSNSVPARPASHGCVRVPRADAKWLLDNISVGMSVHLYGGTHVFPAGSSAPGTDAPTGDTGSDTTTPSRSAKPAPSPTPGSAAPSPTPTDSSTASPAASRSASPAPLTVQPSPSPTPVPA